MATHAGTVHLVDDTLVHLADGMYSFAMLLKFGFDGQPEAADLIGAVLAHPHYADGCFSPWTGPCDDMHGPYQLHKLTVAGFAPCSASSAWAVLMDWPGTNLHPWAHKEMLVSQEIVGAWIAPLIIGAAEVYRLIVPREGNEHDCGWIVGLSGFHEFIAIDRRNAVLTVIIATDD